jgi:hypothetical protein
LAGAVDAAAVDAACLDAGAFDATDFAAALGDDWGLDALGLAS